MCYKRLLKQHNCYIMTFSLLTHFHTLSFYRDGSVFCEIKRLQVYIVRTISFCFDPLTSEKYKWVFLLGLMFTSLVLALNSSQNSDAYYCAYPMGNIFLCRAYRPNRGQHVKEARDFWVLTWNALFNFDLMPPVAWWMDFLSIYHSISLDEKRWSHIWVHFRRWSTYINLFNKMKISSTHTSNFCPFYVIKSSK